MKLDRNVNKDGTDKYALVKLRPMKDGFGPIHGFMPGENGGSAIIRHAAIDFGDTPESEFFVIRLKDKYAHKALAAYALAAAQDESEWANEVFELAEKAYRHQNKKRPD